MSWQEYVDNQICGQVSCRFAVIASLMDGSVWAKFEQDLTSPITQEELRVLGDRIRNNPTSVQESGVRIGGEKYFCISAEPNLVRARRNKSALIAVSTNSCLLVAASQDGISPGQLNNVVEKLGDYLRLNAY